MALDDELDLLEQPQDEHCIMYTDILNLCTQRQQVLHLVDLNTYQYLDLDDELDLLDLEDLHNELDEELEEMVDSYGQHVTTLTLLEQYQQLEAIDEPEV